MYCRKRKVKCFTRKDNDPFGHKLQVTLINVPTFYA